MLKIISRVGSSTFKRGSGLTSPRLQIVSPMSISSSPTTATMSPALADIGIDATEFVEELEVGNLTGNDGIFFGDVDLLSLVHFP
jgi:hypothetical protein